VTFLKCLLVRALLPADGGSSLSAIAFGVAIAFL